jgi:hypothetical protein
MQSPQAAQAMQALGQRGYDPGQATAILNAAAPAAANAMAQQTQGHPEPALGLFNIFGGHAFAEFLTGAVTGLLRGDGVVGSLEDGGMGMIGGHIAEVVAQRVGVNQRVAGEIAAIATPFIVHYVHEHISGHPSVVAQHGHSPHHKHHHHH